MTMPDELRRALDWDPELLSELVQVASLDDNTRAKALTLADVLPKNLDDWLALDTAEPARVEQVLDALEDSIRFLVELRNSGVLDADWRRQVVVTLRHLPELWKFDTWRTMHGRGVAMGSYITRTVEQPSLRADAPMQQDNVPAGPP
ncbi:hypothetical protein [Roseateles sp.]|uniref:hypothetical protein n=1 Tax=Roseateles sp. TaxID=1971397 RepID=UPI0025F7DF57|nr:hypothetical protein [Roseateles sp.]MBV8035547.1 hypothetical protein [Roseateles sp.]